MVLENFSANLKPKGHGAPLTDDRQFECKAGADRDARARHSSGEPSSAKLTKLPDFETELRKGGKIRYR
jgi:hypothetical protein